MTAERETMTLEQRVHKILNDALAAGYLVDTSIDLDTLREIDASLSRAAERHATHCDNCGCDWLDNGINPIGCPYCSRAADPVAFHWHDGKHWSKWMDAALHNDLIRMLEQNGKKIEYAYTHPPEPARVPDAAWFAEILCIARNEWGEKHEAGWLETGDNHPDDWIGNYVRNALLANDTGTPNESA